ncbi:MAG: type IV pilus twitching motility protein PilT [Elusimicrobia bacterium]|nr:type IV pilus twitching motility protein PilT [Elusimicrobiota bacterium]
MKALAARGGSDLHLKVGQPPVFRVNGKLERTEGVPLTPGEITEIFREILGEEKFSRFLEKKEYDFAVDVAGTGRFRGNLFFQKGFPGGVFRLIPSKIPSIDELGLPAVLKNIVKRKQGLILVVGPTGSGKSTTLAALIDELNETQPLNIITVEDPIEFVHQDKKAIINQREIGMDTFSWSDSLRRALRQDPDCILIGEMRGIESISIAIAAAETGHLVFSTLHTNDAKQTIERIVDVFPAEAQNFARHQLALVLVAIVSQRLCEKKDGTGRVAAFEIMINTPTISKAIEENQADRIQQYIAESATFYNMCTLNQSLFRMVRDDVITEDEAFRISNNPNDLKIKLRTSRASENAPSTEKKIRKF